MRKKEREKFKKHLHELKYQIVSGIYSLREMNLSKNHQESSGDLSSAPAHMADLGTDNYVRELSLNLAEEERERLYKIEQALDRIEKNTYGVCEACSKKIRPERLAAVPYASMCIPCQEAVEANVYSRT